MNCRVLILFTLVLISENVFSQNIFNKKSMTNNNKKTNLETVFSQGDSLVRGCTDQTAIEYNPLANIDDGSCTVIVLDPDGDLVKVDNNRYQELLDLASESELIKKQLEESNARFQLLEKNTKVIEDSLRNCLLPKNDSLSIDSFSIVCSGKSYALIIAVQNYTNERFMDLDHPIRDGKDLKKVLEENYIFESVDFVEDPTCQAIRMKFSGLESKVTEDDNVLVFYAGHGFKWNKPNNTDGYWCPSDAEWENSSTLIDNTDIIGFLSKLSSRNILLISDACFAGSIGKTRSPSPNFSECKQEVYNAGSCQYISSGSNTTVPDESVFIKRLIKALRGNKEKYLTASMLFYTHKVNEAYSKTNANVIPSFKRIVMERKSETEEIEIDGDFFFFKK